MKPKEILQLIEKRNWRQFVNHEPARLRSEKMSGASEEKKKAKFLFFRYFADHPGGRAVRVPIKPHRAGLKTLT
jgi:hypothetical protein